MFPTRRRRVATAAGITLALVVLACLAGAIYERGARRRDARAFPPPGRLVEVGGRRLHLICIGAGLPVVLFEASGFSNSLSSSLARGELANRTTVCSYDRAGVGWSDAGPETLTVGALAADLRRLQENAGLTTPLVIVTASVGGLVTEMFARQFPELVSGLVFLDAANSDAISHLESQADPRAVRAACVAARTAGTLGIVRLLDPFRLRDAPGDAGDRAAAVMYRAQPWNALCALVRGVEQTKQEFAAAPALRNDIPLTVLSAASSDGLVPPRLQRWFAPNVSERLQLHQQLARRSTRGTWRLVPGSDHLIASSQPHAVVEAVLDLIGR